MTTGQYLKDHVYHILFGGLGILLAEGVLLLFGSSFVLCVFILLILLGTGALALAYDLLRKKAFYDELRQKLDVLEEKYLLTEMIDAPRFLEGRILYGAYEEILKSMNDEIGRCGRINDEFKRYVETWVHEIKIPIASAELILHNSRKDGGQNENPRRIKEQIGRIESYVEQVLYFIRSEVPQNDYSIGKYSLKEIVENAVRENKDALILQSFAVEVDIGETLVRTDRKWLTFILGQIISNAVKYAGEDRRRLRFWAREVSGKGALSSGLEQENKAENGGFERSSRVRLCIEDNGIGIVPEDIPRVFEKSFTGKNGRRTAATGMGLYICRRLCEELGHRISVESKTAPRTQGESYTRIILEFDQTGLAPSGRQGEGRQIGER